MRQCRAQAGFTLLEVLIAASLLAVMMGLLLGSLRIAVDSWTAGERRSTATSRMLVTANFLRTHLSAAIPLFRNPVAGKAAISDETGGQPQFLFRGDKSGLQYVGALPPQVRGGLYRFDLSWRRADERSDLKLMILPLAPIGGEQNAEPIDDVTVLEDVESFAISYLAANEGDGKVQWLNEWTDPTMPALIRVEIAIQGEPPWPPLVIAPRVEGRQ